MPVGELIGGLSVGLAGGLTSGLLGVSPGGGLTVFSVLLLGAGRHVAQAISLAAQVLPTGLAGARRYWQQGIRSPWRWPALVCAGMIVGGIGGSLAATHAPETALRWSYVAYLGPLRPAAPA